MSDPKPGDRVRVTYEAEWACGWDNADALGVTKDSLGKFSPIVPANATVEVLAPPRPEWADKPGCVGRDRDGIDWYSARSYGVGVLWYSFGTPVEQGVRVYESVAPLTLRYSPDAP